MTDEEKAAAAAAAEKTAADAAAAAAAEAAKTKTASPEELAALVIELKGKLTKTEDEKALLLKETMEKKKKQREAEAAAAANGQSLEQVMGQLKELFGEDVGIDKLQEAVAARKKAEEEGLRKAGDFDSLKERLIGEHKKEVASLTGRLTGELGTKTKELETANAEIRKLLVSNSFAGSKFISEELNLTPSKAERLFGDAFKVEQDGENRVVRAYLGGKPITDGEGKTKAFDEALREIIDADSEKETLFKPKAKAGAGSGVDNQGTRGTPKVPLHGLAAIAAGLDAQKKPKGAGK